jgi:flagellar basal-body rod protein FlgG
MIFPIISVPVFDRLTHPNSWHPCCLVKGEPINSSADDVMQKSIYTPLSGALAQERVMEVIANNLANVNTNGFKGDKVSFKLLESEPERNYKNPLPPANYKLDFEDLQHLKGNDISYAGVAEVSRDNTQGPAIQTHGQLDLMVEGPGMFRVMTPDGVRFTRDGNMALNRDGILTTKSGHPVLGEKGDIALRSGAFKVNDLGEIWQDGEMVDRLQIFDFKEDKQLERVGNNYYFYGGPEEDVSLVEMGQIRQGYIEGSNVNAIKNITNMILAHRSLEAYNKAIKNYDSMMERSSNRIGEVRA